MPRVQSSALEWVEYRKTARILDVGLKTGRQYSYYGVPEREYRGLIRAKSKGSFYNARIRDRYPYWRRPEPD
jgi:hypothetical protein